MKTNVITTLQTSWTEGNIGMIVSLPFTIKDKVITKVSECKQSLTDVGSQYYSTVKDTVTEQYTRKKENVSEKVSSCKTYIQENDYYKTGAEKTTQIYEKGGEIVETVQTKYTNTKESLNE